MNVSSAADLKESAEGALARALGHLGVEVTGRSLEPGTDAGITVRVDDRVLTVFIEAKAYGTEAQAADAIDRTRSVDAECVLMFVADKITAAARDRLTDAGWSWFDRRGRLHLTAPGVRLDVDMLPDPRVGVGSARKAPIGGPGGLAVAYWLCAHPGESVSPTGLTSGLGFAPSTISTANRRLVDAGLVSGDGVGLFPELFWELAAAWHPERRWIATAPPPPPQPVDPTAPRWCVSGTAAAAAYGAPVVSSGAGPVELYVAGPVEISVALRRYHAAEPGTGAASLAVAPVRAVTAPPRAESREPPEVDGWPAAPRLTVALDLAQDRARGRQILDDWMADGAVWR